MFILHMGDYFVKNFISFTYVETLSKLKHQYPEGKT